MSPHSLVFIFHSFLPVLLQNHSAVMISCKVQFLSHWWFLVDALNSLFTSSHGRFQSPHLPPNLTLSTHVVLAVYLATAFGLLYFSSSWQSCISYSEYVWFHKPLMPFMALHGTWHFADDRSRSLWQEWRWASLLESRVYVNLSHVIVQLANIQMWIANLLYSIHHASIPMDSIATCHHSSALHNLSSWYKCYESLRVYE